MSGSSSGLALELGPELADYLRGGQTLAAGARVSVQAREAYPLVTQHRDTVSALPTGG
jgi:hypothetical protein